MVYGDTLRQTYRNLSQQSSLAEDQFNQELGWFSLPKVQLTRDLVHHLIHQRSTAPFSVAPTYLTKNLPYQKCSPPEI